MPRYWGDIIRKKNNEDVKIAPTLARNTGIVDKL